MNSGNWIETLSQGFADLQQLLFEAWVQPVLYAAGLSSILSEAFEGTGWLLVGLVQVGLLVMVIGPLQRWRPAEAPPLTATARAARAAAVRVDMIYTLVHQLGLFRVVLFFTVDPLWEHLFGWLAVRGWGGIQLDEWMAPLWPSVTDTAWASFVLYLVVFDLVAYLVHRAQHHFGWWWALHAVHHSQRHMTMWSDNRNHLLDSVLVDVSVVLVARSIGVAPGQFVVLVALTQLVENLAHANVRLPFGWLGERALVSPRFHRLHHAIAVGHESRGAGSLGGHNFGVLLPLWDLLFATARFDAAVQPTGIRDQLPEHGGRDYGRGFWAQQWLGLLRVLGRA